MTETSPLAPVLTHDGWELLNSLPVYDDAASMTLNQRLRDAGHDAELVAAALTQSRLRRDARVKFGDFAERMLFTDDGLQQSTRLPVAAHHARRFRDAGVTSVADLGCGLGADAMAAAALGLDVVGVESDETTAAAATMNLAAFPEARVEHTAAEDFIAARRLLEPGRAASLGWGVWLDPARRDVDAGRSAGGRTRRLWDPETFSPPLSLVTELAATGAPLGVKLGPGLPHELIPADCEAEWVSLDGQVVEVVLWFNALARPGVRRAATVLRTAGNAGTDDAGLAVEELTSGEDFTATPEGEAAGVAGLTGLLCEPDGAVIRAGLVADLAERLGGRMLDEHIAYFCVDAEEVEEAAASTATVRAYRVIDVLDFSIKRLKRWVAEHGVGRLEIKKRGVDVVPEQLRTQLLGGRKKRDGAAATLVITRLGEDRVAAVVEPLPRR
ncbi:50S ribosomal protein L11 methyltransferase [Nesterenkonia halophila]|uniref:THUMP-like domain-containing protein n=1 Tax=Nesterenkonia halophila TaxID=302044 RepID=UPI001290A60A|nr:SAM-dependent methyltransferase [Nesterenkonia halophila]